MSTPDQPLRAIREGIEVDVQVVPRASRSRIVGIHGGRLKVQVTAPPVEGAANAELVQLVAKALAVPRRDVEVARGTSGKRKTLRIAGIDLPRARSLLGLGVLALACLGGCQPVTTEVDLRVLVPDDSSDLQTANNVSIALSPDGFTETFPTTGLDFALDAELDPDDTVRRLSVYLARSETLLAWGRTPEFTFATASAGAAVFLARPGRLSTFPLGFAVGDPETLAAYAHGWGVIAFGSDGTTVFLDDLTLETVTAAPLISDRGLPDPDDGTLVGDALGGVQRLSWDSGVTGFRFDPGDDSWIELPLDGAPGVGVREGAAHLADTAGNVLFLFGGGSQTDVVAVHLVPPTDGGPDVRRLAGLNLDGPRRGANAAALVRQDTDEGETPILFGGDDPARPAVFLVSSGIALGPETAWVGGRCVQLDHGGAGATLRVLCAGGTRDGAPTADAVVVTVPGAQSMEAPTAQELPELLETPMSDPLWFSSADAVYAQGAGRLLRIAREDLALSEGDGEAPRTRGGSSVLLPGGSAFLIGGVNADDMPVSIWQVFAPTP